MLEFIKRFLHFAEFFKTHTTLHHSRQGFHFEQEFELTEYDSRDVAAFFSEYLQTKNNKIYLNTALLEQFDGWNSFLNEFFKWCEEYFITSNSGIDIFLQKHSEFDLFNLQDWARCMGYNMSNVRRFINFLEIFGLIKKHKNRFHFSKKNLSESKTYGEKCLYFLPNFEVILFNPVHYHLVITLLHLFEFRKMNYEVVFHINQEHLYKVVHSSKELNSLTSLFQYSFNEIPENILFVSKHLQDLHKKIQFAGAGFFFELNDAHLLEHLEQYLKKFPGKYFLEAEKGRLFIHLDIASKFYHYLEENKFGYFKPEKIQEQKLNRYLERFDIPESKFLWQLCAYFSIILNRIRLFGKIEKNYFDKIYQYLGLIYKNEYNLSEKELNDEKKHLRAELEECFSEHILKMGRKIVLEEPPHNDISRYWRQIRHALITNSPVRIVITDEKKSQGKSQLNGYIIAVNQLGLVLKYRKNNKTVFIQWDTVEFVY